MIKYSTKKVQRKAIEVKFVSHRMVDFSFKIGTA